MDEFGFLSSWGSEGEKKDCCNWRGVRCSNQTGHVKVLDLHGTGRVKVLDIQTRVMSRNASLRGTLNPALLKLHYLRHLDLSFNNFSGSQIPMFIGSLSKLEYLDLFAASFSGPIPPLLGNLSRLQYLSLGYNKLLRAGNLDWISQLFSLRYLDLSSCNLSKSTDWLQEVDKIPSLKTLYLEQCDLQLQPTIHRSFSHLNSSPSLETLGLSYNNLTASIYPWLFNVSSNIVDVWEKYVDETRHGEQISDGRVLRTGVVWEKYVDETRHGEQISYGRVLRTGVFRKSLVRGGTGAEISCSSTSTSSARQIPCKRHKAIPARGREARRPGRRQWARRAPQPENLGTTATLFPEPWRNTQDLTELRQPRFPQNRGVTRKIPRLPITQQ